jgi:hypothetical protein
MEDVEEGGNEDYVGAMGCGIPRAVTTRPRWVATRPMRGAALPDLVAEPSVSGRIGAQTQVSISRERFAEVDPINGLRLQPENLVKRYVKTYAPIVRETANINDANVQKILKVTLAAQLINRLYA